ncbi:unnamed protein product [Cuscuta europaea]|uniref:Uncharacterized protein n=1 Tax=Cuscuta europaea TaxID=41803 RepID=A0A9P1EAZ9_CUSEU|nr:unnamed protein product [Cuscuta europaea]
MSRTAEGTSTDADESADESSSAAPNKTDDEASDSVATHNTDDGSDDDNDDRDDSDDVEHTYALIRKGKLPAESPKKITAEDTAPILAGRSKTFTIKDVRQSKSVHREICSSKADYDEAAHVIKNTQDAIIREKRAKIKNDKSSKPKPQPHIRKSLIDKADEDIFAGCDPFFSISRAESLSTGADLLGSRVEVAASGSPAHAQPSPSHALASQQALVSQTRDSPTSLVPSKSVERIVGQPPEVTTPPSHTSSLGVTFPTFSSFSRTPTLFAAHTGAHTLNATTRV